MKMTSNPSKISSTTVSAIPRAKETPSLTEWLVPGFVIALLVFATATDAHAVRLARGVWGSAPAVANHGPVRVMGTLGQPAVGVATSGSILHHGGFWQGLGMPATGVGGSDLPQLRFFLSQNAPNPFNPSTVIRYSISSTERVHLVIYDVAGRELLTLVDELQDAGLHRVGWNGRDRFGNGVSSGVYLYRIRAGSFMETRSMVLLK